MTESKSLSDSQNKRKISRTSSSDDESSNEFEREDDDSGVVTTSASKRQSSHMSSSDNIVSSNLEKQNKVSNFGDIIKEETEDREESSPLPQRPNEKRKNSTFNDLDIFYQ